MVPQRQKNGSSGSAPQNHPMPRIITGNQIDQACHTSTH
jgi:hypothetical protein